MPYKFDYDSAVADYNRENLETIRAQSQQNDPSYLADIAAAPFRGIEGAAKGVYNLADTLTGDALPDYNDRFLGESQTLAGGIVEGITQFATGFIPIGGALGAFGKGASFARGIAAGAVTDFTVFEGHSNRLSNLLTGTALENPVSEFLAADEEDPEIVGRLKNAAEGMLIGGAFEALFLGVRRIKAFNKARAAGKSIPEAEEAAVKAVPEEEMQAAAEKAARAEAEEAVVEEAPVDTRPVVEGEVADEATQATSANGLPRPTSSLPDLGIHGPADVENLINDSLTRASADMDANLNPRQRVIGPDGKQHYVHDMATLLANGLKSRKDLNLQAFLFDADTATVVRTFEDLGRAAGEAHIPTVGTQTVKEIQEQAAESLATMADGKSGLEVAARLVTQGKTINEDLQAVMGKVQGLRAGMKVLSENMREWVAKAALGDPVAMAHALSYAQPFAELVQHVKGAGQGFGRGLRMQGADVIDMVGTIHLNDPAVAAKFLEANGGKDAQQLMEQLSKVLDGTDVGIGKAAKLLTGPKPKGIWDNFYSYWYDAVLSGPRTHTTIQAASAMVSAYQPFELVMGGAITRNKSAVQQGILEWKMLADSFSESLALAKQSFKENRSIGRPDNSVVGEATKQVTSSSVDAPTWQAQAARWVADKWHTPTKLIRAGDEFWQQMNYRAVTKASLAREGMDMGLRGGALDKHIQEGLSRVVYQGQFLSFKQLYKRGIDEARARGVLDPQARNLDALAYVKANMEQLEKDGLLEFTERASRRGYETTASAPLEKGSIGKDLQDFTTKHPVARLFMPFVKSQVNIAKWAGQRFDYVSAAQLLAAKRMPNYATALEESKRVMVQDLLSNNPIRRAEAAGKFATGISAGAFLWNLVGEGYLTGKGPTDKDELQALKDAGWQEYSVRVGDTWIQYSRFDPLATILGLVTDTAELARWSHDEDQDAIEQLGLGVIVALTNNLTNKSYVMGLQRLSEAMTDPQRAVPIFARTLAGSLVPNALAQSTFDPVQRDVNSMIEQMQKRTPFLNTGLGPKRNFLGEPVKAARFSGDGWWKPLSWFNPVAYSTMNNETISNELFRLQEGFTPPKKIRNGINLIDFQKPSGQNAYDRWLELHGEVRIGGRTLKEKMRDTIKSVGYQQLSPASVDGIQSPRIGELRRIVDRYRGQAYRQLMREYPDLNQQELIKLKTKADLRAGTLQ